MHIGWCEFDIPQCRGLKATKIVRVTCNAEPSLIDPAVVKSHAEVMEPVVSKKCSFATERMNASVHYRMAYEAFTFRYEDLESPLCCFRDCILVAPVEIPIERRIAR